MAEMDDTTSAMERKAKHAARMRAYRKDNPEKFREIDKEQARRKKERDPEGHAAAANERSRRYCERLKANPLPADEAERRKKAARERNRRYYQKNIERVRSRKKEEGRERYAANPEKALAIVKKYQATPKGQDAVRANARKRYAAIKKAGGTVTAADWRAILAAHGNRCNYCKKDLTLVKGDCSMDHVIPLTKGGRHSPENVVPACRSCNSKKYNKLPIADVTP